MPTLFSPGSASLLSIKHLAILGLAFCSCAYGQISYPGLEVHVSNLPKVMARSDDAADLLLASLETILQDNEVCCGKDSALEDSAQRADPASLPDMATKLQGRHLLSDGRPIMVTGQYIAPNAINGFLLIETLQQRHAVLMLWQSHLYVCYGVTYRKDYDSEGRVTETILTFLLIDTRYSDSRREVVFDRATDDWSQVQGVLWIAAAPQ